MAVLCNSKTRTKRNRCLYVLPRCCVDLMIGEYTKRQTSPCTFMIQSLFDSLSSQRGKIIKCSPGCSMAGRCNISMSSTLPTHSLSSLGLSPMAVFIYELAFREITIDFPFYCFEHNERFARPRTQQFASCDFERGIESVSTEKRPDMRIYSTYR